MTNWFTTQSKEIASSPPFPPILTLLTATGTLNPSTSSPWGFSLLTVLGSVTFSCVQTLMKTFLPDLLSLVLTEKTGSGVIRQPSWSFLIVPSAAIFLPSGILTSSFFPIFSAPGKGVSGLFFMNSSAFFWASSKSIPLSSACFFMSVSSLVMISSKASGSSFSSLASMSNAIVICSLLAGALGSPPPAPPMPSPLAALLIPDSPFMNSFSTPTSWGTSPRFIDSRLSITDAGSLEAVESESLEEPLEVEELLAVDFDFLPLFFFGLELVEDFFETSSINGIVALLCVALLLELLLGN
mmetsp:Transcript_18568/g.34439  ORF Transcript_18568/g.34439 Transcript_18568/m.34439 type:complete len:298 (-) Transcript_18568:165-1058(-)